MKGKLIIKRYLPTNFFVHHLDPGAKLMFVFLPTMLIFFCRSPLTHLWVFALVLFIMRLAEIQLWFLIKGLTPIFFFLILALMMHVFSTKGGYVLVEWHGITIETNSISEGPYISLRLIGTIMIATIMTLSTSPIDLTNAFERLLAPLKMFKLPVHQLSMIMSIALWFAPTLMDELDRIILTQKSRGSEISSGNIVTRTKSSTPLLAPLFISAFQRAEELAVAMEIRDYDANVKRASYKQLKWQLRDTISLTMIIPIAVILFVLEYSEVQIHAYVSRNYVSRK